MASLPYRVLVLIGGLPRSLLKFSGGSVHDYATISDESGLPRSLLKFSGGSVHDYATISDESPSPS